MEIDLKNRQPNIRYLIEMKKVVYDKNWFSNADKQTEIYYMYRGLEEKNGIRYDITTMPALMMGSEPVKTKGHYHIGKYQEIYKVLKGRSIYLMQKRKYGKEDEIEDVYAVKCQKGDVIIIKPDYGHITINPAESEELKMANWISKDCQSDYSLFEKLGGACYYYINKSWLKNKNYKLVPDLRFEKPIKSVPENLNFLKEKYLSH